MASGYAPNLIVEKGIKISRSRVLPLLGKVHVAVGDRVSSDDVVLTADLPGEISVIKLSQKLDFEPERIADSMKVEVGNTVNEGDSICVVKSFFNLFTSTYKAPHDGTIEFFIKESSQIGIRRPARPIEVNAYISGVTTNVLKNKGATISGLGSIAQGIFGIGGERLGELFVLDVGLDEVVEREVLDSIFQDQNEIEGKVVVGGSSMSKEAIEWLIEKGAVGIVTASLCSSIVYHLTKREENLSVTGDEEIPYTLIITEGFGSIPFSEKTYNLLKEFHGKKASINGATQVRAGATRPEIIIMTNSGKLPEQIDGGVLSFEVGQRVRMIRHPYFGKLGQITELPNDPMQIETGAKVRVAKIKLDNSDKVVNIPRANLELI